MRMIPSVALTAVLGLTLSGCSLFGDDLPDPQEAADVVAEDLSEGTLDPALFSGVDALPSDLQSWWEEQIEGLDAESRAVEVESVEESDDGLSADARLEWEWELGTGATWSYTSTARLSLDQSAAEPVWLVEAVPSLLAPDLRDGERLDAAQVNPERAPIVGDDGRFIINEREVLRYGIDKTRIRGEASWEASARNLARLLDLDSDAYAERVLEAGDKAFVEALVLRNEDVTGDISDGVAAIDGAIGLRDSLPLAPTREFARPILGTFGAVTAEIVEESDGRYEAGDEAGLSGLQARYDEQLRGEPGTEVAAVNADGDRRTLWEDEATPGEPLELTLDLDLQQSAEQLLAGVGPASALVAVRPSDGAVLAAASGPGGGGLSTATTGQFAPGSTMKVASSLALLRAGLEPGSALDCPATITVDGRRFSNYSDYPSSGLGRIDLARALANSCNTAFIGARDRVSQAELAAAAGSLGLGIDHDLGYPVFLGSVPAEATGETDAAASLIGQGRVLASPVAMAAVAASVVAGETVTPILVKGFGPSDADAPEPLTRAEAQSLRELMQGVVSGGSAAFLGDVPGPPILAKTGTAEFGQQVPPQTHAWMIAAQGDLAVAVFVEVGASGSRTAGPILEEFVRSRR